MSLPFRLVLWLSIIPRVLAALSFFLLADRFGHLAMLVAGYVLGTLTARLAALAFVFQVQTVPLLALIFSVAGLYMAIQEALESTVTAEMVDTDTLATGIGVLGSVNGVAKFVSSAAVGLLWTGVSPLAAFGGAAALMAAGTAALLAVDRRGT